MITKQSTTIIPLEDLDAPIGGTLRRVLESASLS